MKHNVWIFNHYATNMYKNQGGRHYWFAEKLIEKGYEPTIFCANTFHNSNDFINIKTKKYKRTDINGIPFVFVKTNKYANNGGKRILNMMSFYNNIFSATKEYIKYFGKPDVIIASSVHPLTLVAGIKIAKKIGVPCICEVRDLWPESLVAYDIINKKNLITKGLYRGEKWIYKKADSIIMTWEGGKQYIIDQHWDKQIDIKKVNYISNGVVLDTFDRNSEKYTFYDKDLENQQSKKVIYAGSIRRVNNIKMILEAASLIKKQENEDDIQILIYGDGDEKEILKNKCKKEGINNVIFKGKVEKKYIPFILKKADINILHNTSTSLDKYGQSQNKLFEYLAAGRCIVQTYRTGYSICEKFDCGLSAPFQNAKEIAKTIINTCNDDLRRVEMGTNAREAAKLFDFNKLTDNLIDVIESTERRE